MYLVVELAVGVREVRALVRQVQAQLGRAPQLPASLSRLQLQLLEQALARLRLAHTNAHLHNIYYYPTAKNVHPLF